MAKNFIKNIAAVIIMAGAMMASCTKDGRVDEHEQMENDGNIMVSITAKGPQSDSTFTVINKSERFVDNDLEFVVEVKHNGTETYRASAGNALDGVDPQFFHEADTSLVTKPGNAERTVGTVEVPVQREGKPFATWVFEVETEVSDYMVENKSDLKFNHALTEKRVISAKFIYDADIKGTKKAEAVFEVPSREAKEGQQKIEEVMGVVHEGKTYEAFKYGYQRVVNYTIAPEYKIAGESSELTLEATNVAYLLKHEVKTELENLKYIGIFKIEGNELKTDRQEVSFDLVTYDNGEKVERESKHFVLPMELYFRFIKVNDGWFEKEEDLYNEKVEVVPGELTETTGKTDGAYTEKVGRRVYTIKTIDGTYEAVYSYSHWVGHEKIENLYAYLEGMENVLIEAVKNIYESTVAVDVVDAKASVKLNIISPEKKEEAPMETNWKRMRQIPDDWTEEYSVLGYLLNLQKISDRKINAKDNTISLRKVMKNHGIVVDTKDTTYQQVAEIELNGKVDTTIRDFRNLYKDIKYTVEDKGNKVSWSEKDENGVQRQKVEDGVKVIMNTGKSFDLDGTFEKPYQNGKPFGNWCEVRDVTAANISVQDVKVDSVKTETTITYFGQYTVVVKPVFVSTENQTKAENNVNKDVLSITYYDKFVVGDTFVSDRIEKTVTKNGNKIDWSVKLYETWSLTGEKVVDEKKGTLTPSLNGSNGGEIVVANTSFNTTGNGTTTIGSGSYSDDASNGTDTFKNNYTYNAPASVNVQLNGSKGTKSETISASWALVEVGQKIGSQSVTDSYYVYPYTNTVKGTYTVENQSVELTAEATKTLKVVRNVPKIIPEEWGKITFAGFSAVPAHLVNNQDGFVNGNVADGNGAQTAASCLTIVTDKGAVPVIFGWADQEPRVPSTSQILNSTFTEGNYTGYNSGWYNGKVWVPAMAADSGQGIGYSIPSQSNIRFVRNESLVMWGWRSGNYSTKLSGYTTSVNDGTLTISYNGQIVLEIR